MKFKVCVAVVTYTANYIEIEADNEEAAILRARDEWYSGIGDFSTKCLEETIEDITIEETIKPAPTKPAPLTYEEIVALIRKDVYSYPVESLQGRLEMHQKYGYMNSPSDNIERDFIKERITSLGI